jgi:hypothetical protein
LNDFQQLCNGQSLDKVLSQIKFVIRSPCYKPIPGIPCGVDHPSPIVPGKSCKAEDICFSSFVCSASTEVRANDLLFELGNWCNCTYHKMGGGEGPTEKMCRDCGFPPGQCIGGGAGMPIVV